MKFCVPLGPVASALPAVAFAADEHPLAFAWLWMMVSLTLVCGVILALGYVAKRYGWVDRLRELRGQRLRLSAALALGGRERLMIVHVDDRELLLGVAPGMVRLLDTLPARPDNAEGAAFSGVWRKALHQQVSEGNP